MDSAGYEFLTCVDADSPSYLDESVESGKEYRYRVRAVYYATTRCVTPRDIELTSGTPVARSTGGVWSDGDTIWVAHASDSRLHAYDLATGAAQADDDITPASTYADIDGGDGATRHASGPRLLSTTKRPPRRRVLRSFPTRDRMVHSYRFS